jgi:hypothetical protein
MAYCTRDEVEALIPTERLAEALRDPVTKAEKTGLMVAIMDSASLAVDAMIGGKLTTPLTSPYPSLARRAAIVLSLESIWKRIGVSGSSNPWNSEADALRDMLKEVGSGTKVLQPGVIYSFTDTERVFSESESAAQYEVTDE